MSDTFKKIKIVSGRAFSLLGDNIDTDRIIPARYLKCVTFDGLGKHVFEDDRMQLKGVHPFDRAQNKGRNILLVGENFGSGSSREHAVPALMQWGVHAIIGLSFAEIFLGNAVGNGLVCVTMSKEVHAELLGQLSRDEIKWMIIDLDDKTVEVDINGSDDGDRPRFDCAIPESAREDFVMGRWDHVATCLEAGAAIEETALRLPYAIIAR